MKSRTHICLAIGMLVTIISVLGAFPAAAQRFGGRELFLQPRVRVPAAGGQIYLQGGVKFRNVQTFRLNSLAHSVEVRENGVPPFGPNAEGEFGTGTGVPGFPLDTTDPGWLVANADPDVSGIWLYNNGHIDPRSPCLSVDACRGILMITSPPAHCCITNPGPGGACPDDYPEDDNAAGILPGSVQIGRFVGVDYPAPWPSGISSGWFSMLDPNNQANSTSPVDTTAVSFTRMIDGTYDSYYCNAGSGEVASQIWRAPGIVFANLEYMEKIWTPAFEIGYQYTNFFDFFYGFSFFDLSRTMSKTGLLEAELYRRTFTDTFPYFSSGSAADTWRGAFDSVTAIPGNEDADYYLWADGQGQGFFPSRSFGERRDQSQPDRRIQEILTHRADIHVYENRLGVTSWFPLYGMGRMGFSVGALLSYIYYRMSGTRSAVALETLDPENDPPVFPAGTVLTNEANSIWDWWFNYGGFVGTDVEVEYDRYFLRGTAEWAFCEMETYQLFSILTEFNPGGFSYALTAGARF